MQKFRGETKPILMDYFLKPGYIFVPDRPTVISVVLGSSVAVCLYDKKRQRGGMNNFQLPFTSERAEATPRYGHVATLALVEMMLHWGSKLRHLEAQVFGGANNPEICPQNIGRENVRIARKVLAKKGIHIVSEDTEGEKGRKIVFDTNSSEIAALKVDRLRSGDWYPYEEKR